MKSAEILPLSLLSFESNTTSVSHMTVLSLQMSSYLFKSVCIRKIQAQEIWEEPTGSDSCWQLQEESRYLSHSHHHTRQTNPSPHEKKPVKVFTELLYRETLPDAKSDNVCVCFMIAPKGLKQISRI